MADSEQPIEGSSAAPAAAIPSSILPSQASTIVPSMTSSEASTAFSQLVLTLSIEMPAKANGRKRIRADTAKGGAGEGSATGEAAKPATKKTRKKKMTGGVEDCDKPTRFSWLKASSEAFLDFLKLLIIAGKETNGASFKATNYANAIPYIKSKSGQDLTVKQLSNKYDY